MTEHELNTLKSILNQADPSSSTQIDDKILRAAAVKAQQQKQQLSSKTRFQRMISLLVSPMRLPSLGSAVLSIGLTVAVFLGLSNLIKVDQVKVDQAIPSVAIASQGATEIHIHSNHKATGATQQKTVDIAKSDFIAETPPAMINPRDELLAVISLPKVSTVVDGMRFDKEADRSLATDLVAQAMTDIKAMIQSGEYNRARSRFDQLRQRCSVCTLPDSLELLVQNGAYKVSSG